MLPKVLKLQSIMDDRGLTIARVSRSSGVSASTIKNWLSDTTTPNIKNFERALNALGYKMRIVEKTDG